MRFAVYLLSLRNAMQASTALNYCSLVRNHLAALIGVPLSSRSVRWRRLAKALKKAHTRERREGRPLRISHLRTGLQHHLGRTDPEGVNQWATLACGVHLLARPKELCNLRRSHLSFKWDPAHGWYAVILLSPLKKGPEQKPVPILIASGDGSGADAYLALRRLAHFDPVPDRLAATTPLFRASGRPLSVPVISGWVKAIARSLGQVPELFSARSLRIGGATELHAVGADEFTISLLGRWASDCAKLYARASQGQVLSLSRLIGAAPDDPVLGQVFPDCVQTARR